MEKYSIYPIDAGACIDERHARQPWFHYGFIAASGDGKHASILICTWTPCTGHGDRLAEGYLLFMPRRRKLDYFFSTANQDDICREPGAWMDFCVIPIGQWRQSLYDYAKEVSEETRRHFMGGGPVDDSEACRGILARGERLDALTDLAYAVASDNFADDAIQEKIQEYRDAYGALPDEFLKLLEDRDDG